MAISIGDAILFLGADDKKLAKGLKGAERTTGKSMANMSKSVDSFGTRWNATFAKVGIGIASYLSVSSVKNALAQWSATGDALEEMAQRTGVGVTMLSKLSYAANLSGTNLEGLEGGVRKMQKAIEGSDKAFQRLGIDLVGLKSMNVENQFLTTLGAVARIPDATSRAAAAMAVFGKTGTSILPLVSGGLEEFNAQLEKAQKMGAVWSPEQASNAAAYADSVSNIGTAFQALSNAASAELAPSLVKLLDLATELINRLREREERGGWVPNPIRGWADFLGNVRDTMKGPNIDFWGWDAKRIRDTAAASGQADAISQWKNQLARESVARGGAAPPPSLFQYDRPAGPEPGPMTPMARPSTHQRALDKGGEIGMAERQTVITNNYNTTISHANFTAGDDMIRALNRKIAMSPGI